MPHEILPRPADIDPELSVVVPLHDEEANVRPLIDATREALGRDFRWELLLVDDGSRDATAAIAAAAARSDARVRVLRLARNYGQTQAMQAGFDHARGETIVTMDGDLQNDPRDIPRLVAMLDEGYDLVTGYRVRRQDDLVKRKLPSWVANRIIARLSGVPVRDNGCSLKAYRRSLIRRMYLYSDMHRFLPALAHATAGARIAEVPVQHHARAAGRSKYGLSRVFKIMADLVVIKMIASFRERPLAMFGAGAIGAMMLAGAAGLFSIVSISMRSLRLIGGYVMPTVALLLLLLASYLLLLGLVGEVALRSSPLARSGWGQTEVPE